MDDQNERAELRRAQVARDRARLRLRRATGGVIAGAITLSGTFAALAAGTTQAKKVSKLRPVARQRTALPPLTVAPPAPLVAAHTAPPPPPIATPSPSAPAQSYAPPVVVSGGS